MAKGEMQARKAILVVGFLVVGLASAAGAQSAEGSDRGSSFRMRDTTIEGERPTPDVFFIVPTGKGGNLRVPHRRDYSSEILEPVVKPWLEKDDNVSLVTIQHVARGTSDWKAALDAPAPAPLPPAPSLEAVMPPTRRDVGIPPAALSRPPVGIPETARQSSPPVAAPPPPPPPRRVIAAPPPPPPLPPSPPPQAQPPPPPPRPSGGPSAYERSPSESVPILVPPQ